MKTVISYIMARTLIFGVIAVGAIGIGAWVLLGGAHSEAETLTVEPGEFVQQVSLSGKVISAQKVDLGFSQGGRITRVNVSVGDTVPAGYVLAEVENGDLRATVLERQAALEREQAALAALESGTRPEEVAVAESKRDSDAIALSQAQASLAEEIRDAYRASDTAIHNTVDQFFTNPRTDPELVFLVSDSQLENSVENTRSTLETVLTLWQQEVASLSEARASDTTTQHARENLQKVVAFLTDSNAALNRAIPTGDVTQTDIDGFVSAIATARSNVNTAVAALTTAITNEKQASATLETSQRNVVLARAGATPQDIAVQEAQIRSAQAAVAHAQSQLRKTIIVAPFSGVVTVVDAKVGKTAAVNAPEISLASQGKFQIESFVPEINLSLLTVGDEARVTLDAYGEDEVFPARIVSIDPAETVRDGVSTYRSLFEFKVDDPRIRAGMTANIMVTALERENVISVPVGAIVEEEGQRYVWVQDGEVARKQPVEVGEVSSFGSQEILSGLAAGDVVILSPLP